MITGEWLNQLDCFKTTGVAKTNLRNFKIILANYSEICEKLWLDEISGMPMFGIKTLDDNDVLSIGYEISQIFDMNISNTRLLKDCIVAQCYEKPKDLIRDWLHSLPAWDKKARLESWLPSISGAADNAYSRSISKLIPISMVARALDPGCLYRSVVIFESAENAGKSSLVRALAVKDDWYVEMAVNLGNKEAHMTLKGTWIAEWPELDSMSNTTENKLKSFITMRYDKYVPKYSNFRISVPRRTIFIGTTNDESYLKGKSSNTRFLPIKLGNKIDVEKFINMREQIFAEAYHEYEKNLDTWWDLPEEALKQAIAEREDRRELNVYEEPLRIWLTGKTVTTWAEIAGDFLRLETPAQWKDKALQMQTADALKSIGWKRDRVWIDDVRVRGWRLDHDGPP